MGHFFRILIISLVIFQLSSGGISFSLYLSPDLGNNSPQGPPVYTGDEVTSSAIPFHNQLSMEESNFNFSFYNERDELPEEVLEVINEKLNALYELYAQFRNEEISKLELINKLRNFGITIPQESLEILDKYGILVIPAFDIEYINPETGRRETLEIGRDFAPGELKTIKELLEAIPDRFRDYLGIILATSGEECPGAVAWTSSWEDQNENGEFDFGEQLEWGIIGITEVAATEYNKRAYAQVFLHEVGHNVEFNLTRSQLEEWKSLHAGSGNDPMDFAELYGMTDQAEDFAACFAAFITAPKASLARAVSQAEGGNSEYLDKMNFMMDLLTSGGKTTYVSTPVIPYSLDEGSGIYAREIQIDTSNLTLTEESHIRLGISYLNLFANMVAFLGPPDEKPDYMDEISLELDENVINRIFGLAMEHFGEVLTTASGETYNYARALAGISNLIMGEYYMRKGGLDEEGNVIGEIDEETLAQAREYFRDALEHLNEIPTSSGFYEGLREYELYDDREVNLFNYIGRLIENINEMIGESEPSYQQRLIKAGDAQAALEIIKELFDKVAAGEIAEEAAYDAIKAAYGEDKDKILEALGLLEGAQASYRQKGIGALGVILETDSAKAYQIIKTMFNLLGQGIEDSVAYEEIGRAYKALDQDGKDNIADALITLADEAEYEAKAMGAIEAVGLLSDYYENKLIKAGDAQAALEIIKEMFADDRITDDEAYDAIKAAYGEDKDKILEALGLLEDDHKERGLDVLGVILGADPDNAKDIIKTMFGIIKEVEDNTLRDSLKAHCYEVIRSVYRDELNDSGRESVTEALYELYKDNKDIVLGVLGLLEDANRVLNTLGRILKITENMNEAKKVIKKIFEVDTSVSTICDVIETAYREMEETQEGSGQKIIDALYALREEGEYVDTVEAVLRALGAEETEEEGGPRSTEPPEEPTLDDLINAEDKGEAVEIIEKLFELYGEEEAERIIKEAMGKNEEVVLNALEEIAKENEDLRRNAVELLLTNSEGKQKLGELVDDGNEEIAEVLLEIAEEGGSLARDAVEVLLTSPEGISKLEGKTDEDLLDILLDIARSDSEYAEEAVDVLLSTEDGKERLKQEVESSNEDIIKILTESSAGKRFLKGLILEGDKDVIDALLDSKAGKKFVKGLLDDKDVVVVLLNSGVADRLLKEVIGEGDETAKKLVKILVDPSVEGGTDLLEEIIAGGGSSAKNLAEILLNIDSSLSKGFISGILQGNDSTAVKLVNAFKALAQDDNEKAFNTLLDILKAARYVNREHDKTRKAAFDALVDMYNDPSTSTAWKQKIYDAIKAVADGTESDPLHDDAEDFIEVNPEGPEEGEEEEEAREGEEEQARGCFGKRPDATAGAGRGCSIRPDEEKNPVGAQWYDVKEAIRADEGDLKKELEEWAQAYGDGADIALQGWMWQRYQRLIQRRGEESANEWWKKIADAANEAGLSIPEEPSRPSL